MRQRMCTNRQIGKLSQIGYPESKGGIALHDALEWIMNVKGFYVMPMPVSSKVFPYFRWKATIVILGKANTHDGLLNACELDRRFYYKDEAEVYGFNHILDSLCHAKEVSESISDEEIERMASELRESGFDI